MVFVEDGKILLVKANYKTAWTPPGGVVDHAESPAAAAIRETKEEIGISLSPDDISLLTVSYTHGQEGFTDRYAFIFRAHMVIGATPLQLQEEEIEEAKWVPIEDMDQYIEGRQSYLALQQMLLSGVTTPYIELNHA